MGEAFAVEVEARLPETRACREDARVSARVNDAPLQRLEIGLRQRGSTVGVRLKIVDQRDTLQPEFRSQRRRADVPREIRRDDFAAEDGARDAEEAEARTSAADVASKNHAGDREAGCGRRVKRSNAETERASDDPCKNSDAGISLCQQLRALLGFIQRPSQTSP